MSEAKLRELNRLFQIIKTPSVIFLRKNDSPLKDGAEARIEFDIEFGQGLHLSATNYILNQINGQPQGLSLRLSVYFNIILYENFYKLRINS